jgi:hypothetical protein
MKHLLKQFSASIGYQTNKKQIILLSDDWGSVRIKSKEDQNQLVKKGLSINNRFDLYDTLETNDDLELLFEVLTKYKDYKENHPVITAVANVGNPDFNKIKENHFKNYYFETIQETYQRYPNSDRVLALTHEGIQNKIFIPQSHGREHVQVNWWLQELQDSNSVARKVFENQYFFIGANSLNKSKRGRGIGAAFDVWDELDIESHKCIAKSALSLFEELYGYKSKVFSPPAMFYNPSLEDTLVKGGIDWLDVGRFFKIPLSGGGERYQYNYLGRNKKSGLKVLVRNCMFESNISTIENGVSHCLSTIEQAFKFKQPALISNHRACFVGRIDQKNRDKGLKAFDLLLKTILEKWPDAEFISIDKLVNKL